MKSRSFEFLAATGEMGYTQVPGNDSFTRALIYALVALVDERTYGRFTTVELLNKIKTDAPDFPKDQTPMLIKREKKHSAGRIMLHPLRREGRDDESERKEAASHYSLCPFKARCLTLHFDFSEKPSSAYLETLGRELNDFFRHNIGVNRVRWGGMRPSMTARAVNTFQDSLKRRRASMRLQESKPSDGFSEAQLPRNALDPLTPSSLGPHSPQMTETVGESSPELNLANPADIGATSPSRPFSTDESEGHAQEHRERRKRQRSTCSSDGTS